VTSASQHAVSGGTPTTTYTYNGFGEVLTMTDPQSNVTSYQYDARGNRTAVTDALSNQTTFAYDAGDRLTSVTDAAGHVGRRRTPTDRMAEQRASRRLRVHFRFVGGGRLAGVGFRKPVHRDGYKFNRFIPTTSLDPGFGIRCSCQVLRTISSGSSGPS